MAPKSKDAASAPTITTHHSMAAGGQPSAAHEPSDDTGENSKVVLTRPKKLVLQPTHAAAPEEASVQKPNTEDVSEPIDNNAPLVLETAAETEAAANKLAAKLPEDKIELPLQDAVLEEIPEADEKSEELAQDPKTTATGDVKDPGESAGAAEEVDPNEARAQKAEALMASGTYTVHIHESSRSRTGLFVAIITGVVVIVAAVYFAAAEDMLDIGVDLPKFW